jgi:hypothetical protein
VVRAPMVEEGSERHRLRVSELLGTHFSSGYRRTWGWQSRPMVRGGAAGDVTYRRI